MVIETMEEKTNISVGRRKCAVARVTLREGTGRCVINEKPLQDYFPQTGSQIKVMAPLTLLELQERYDVIVNVFGGGYCGQADAVKLGIARQLILLNPKYREMLKSHNLLSRDSRVKERKKYGRKRARKRFQFSKR